MIESEENVITELELSTEVLVERESFRGSLMSRDEGLQVLEGLWCSPV